MLTPVFFAAVCQSGRSGCRGKIKSIEADAVLSFLTQTNILTVLATRGLNTRTVISERNDPRLQRHRRRVELLRKFLYRRADIVTANSRGALTALEAFVPREKLAFLPNPLALPASIEVARLEAPTIITVGRLVEQKGLDVLITAWAKAAPRLPGWRLAIVGDGPLRGELEALAQTLGVDDSIDWYGHLADPFPLVRAAKFFVLTSRFEGTPNALLEAMACGLPGVVSDASPGPCELAGEDQSAGLIVPVEDAKRDRRWPSSSLRVTKPYVSGFQPARSIVPANMKRIGRSAYGSSFSAASRRVNIAFVIPGLGPGGAERVVDVALQFLGGAGPRGHPDHLRRRRDSALLHARIKVSPCDKLAASAGSGARVSLTTSIVFRGFALCCGS